MRYIYIWLYSIHMYIYIHLHILYNIIYISYYILYNISYLLYIIIYIILLNQESGETNHLCAMAFSASQCSSGSKSPALGWDASKPVKHELRMLSLGHGDTVDGGNLIKSINIDDNHRIYISLIIIIMDIYIYILYYIMDLWWISGWWF